MGLLKKAIKKVESSAKKITGLSGHDLTMIGLSPFTAGASLMGTSSAKNMLKNPSGTIAGGLNGFASGGPIGALLGAMSGGGAFGSESEGTSASSAVQEQYEHTLALQKQNQEWQTQMSNTAHQREVKDLEAAGLNPVLSAGGNGATTGTPGGGTVGMPDKVAEKTAKMQNKIAEMTLINELANSAVQRAKGNAEIKNETDKTQAEVNKLMKEAGYTDKQIEYYNKYGVFPGATLKGSLNGKVGPLAAGASGEIPVGLKIQNTTSAKKEKNNNKNSKNLKALEGLW